MIRCQAIYDLGKVPQPLQSTQLSDAEGVPAKLEAEKSKTATCYTGGAATTAKHCEPTDPGKPREAKPD
jgi:hypothetical protein